MGICSPQLGPSSPGHVLSPSCRACRPTCPPSEQPAFLLSLFQATLHVLLLLHAFDHLVFQLALQLAVSPGWRVPPSQPLRPLPEPQVLPLPQQNQEVLGGGLAGRTPALAISLDGAGLALRLPPQIQVSQRNGLGCARALQTSRPDCGGTRHRPLTPTALYP